ncbi:MAG: alpha/beta hydrolase [Clostridia bacterium]|nr:alpha/beta hydrolase [Clostridia bacterium]
MKQFTIKAKDGFDIGIDLWDEVSNPIGCVQIAHGMAEHPDRYDDFAKFLNKSGYIVAADDHRGHRRGAYNGEKGLVNGDSWNQTIEDMDCLCEYLKEQYKLPILLLGHSYGSFLSQAFCERYSSKIIGCILSGTSHMKNALTIMGRCISGMMKTFQGGNKPGKIIDKLSFGEYNKPFLDQGQQFAWLSRDKEQVEKYQNDPDCGYVLCNDYYYYFLKGVTKLYGDDAKSIRKDFPIMIAVGSMDPVSSNAKNAYKLNEFYKGIGLNPVMKVYENARHEILNEINNQEVYNDFLDFINNAFQSGNK